MSKYTREPDHNDFLEWAKNNPQEYRDFFDDHLSYLIQDLEQDDYFGTEGFDKRFA